MLNQELRKIARVQKVDSAILELQKRFNAIDPGRSIAAQLEEARRKKEEAEAALKAVRTEAEDLELGTKALDSKIEAEKKKLYSGGVYNAKDAENIDKEVKNLMARRGANDDKLLVLWDQVEPAKQAVLKATQEFEAVEAKFREYSQKYAAAKSDYENRLSQLQEARKKDAENCDPGLLAKYDAMRQKRGGIGLAAIVEGVCTACHTAVPRKQLGDLKEGASLQTCENCLRYMYLEDEA